MTPNEKPILFSSEMVKAILENRKFQTRRLVKPQPNSQGIESFGESWEWTKGTDSFSGCTKEQMAGDAGLLYSRRGPYFKGMNLWVKETFARIHEETFARIHEGLVSYLDPDPDNGEAWNNGWSTVFRADGEPANWKHYGVKWKPSIFMPHKLSRITLEIVSIGVERLNDISLRDAIDEGVSYDVSKEGGDPIFQFKKLWESINGKGSWAQNPWVWKIEFRKL